MYNYCPSSFSGRSARSRALGCNWRYRYHCLRNKKDEMIEKCLEFSWMEKGKCAVYDTEAKQIDAWPCNITRGVCPQEQYQSQDVISYSACVPLSYSTKISTDGRNVHEDSRNNNNTITTTTTATINNNTNNVDVDGTDRSLVFTSVTSSAVIGIVVVILAAVGYWYWKRKRNLGKDEESTEPLINFPNNGKKRTQEAKHHLMREERDLKFFAYKGESPKHIMRKTKEHLKNNNNVFIIGKPGSGKTALAWTLCKQMHGEIYEGKRWHVITQAKKSTIANLHDANHKVLLFMDGRFESAWTTEATVKKELGELDELRNKSSSTQILILATLSTVAYKRISKYNCTKKLQPIEIIDLDSKSNILTTADMTKVFDTYGISVHNVNETSQSRVLSQEQLQSVYGYFNCTIWQLTKIYNLPNLGFPLMALLMSLNPDFLGNFSFIQKPMQHILESINRLRDSSEHTDKNKYCTIVYASLNWGYVDTNNVDHYLLTEIGEQHGYPGAEIDPYFYILRKRTDTRYEFLHESLLQAFFAAYGEQYMGFVIAHCPLQVLLEYSVSNREYSSRKEKPFYLKIGGTDYEETLIRRIRDENVDIRHHRIWEQIIELRNT